MALNLTIDQGNSSTKIALWNAEGELVETSTRMHFVAKDARRLTESHDIDNAIYCTVTQRPPTMLKSLAQNVRNVVEFTAETPIPLSIEYASPQTLGLDRLAAAVGAYMLIKETDRPILVVDLGTAITYDIVRQDARYCGGNIAPGIYMRLKALNHYTARLPLVDPRSSEPPLWGDDTKSALLAGAIRGVVAEVEYYRHKSGADTIVVMTGRDSEIVAPLLSFKPVIEPNLVSKGLLEIIRYNTRN